MGGVLGVEIVVLAASTPILLVGGRDLEDRDLCLLHEAQEPCAVLGATPVEGSARFVIFCTLRWTNHKH